MKRIDQRHLDLTIDGNFNDNLFSLLRYLTQGQSVTRLTDPHCSHGNAAAWLKTCSSVSVSTRPFTPLQQEDQVKETLSLMGGDIMISHTAHYYITVFSHFSVTKFFMIFL